MQEPPPLPRLMLKYIAVHSKISRACVVEQPPPMASFRRVSSTTSRNSQKTARSTSVPSRFSVLPFKAPSGFRDEPVRSDTSAVAVEDRLGLLGLGGGCCNRLVEPVVDLP